MAALGHRPDRPGRPLGPRHSYPSCLGRSGWSRSSDVGAPIVISLVGLRRSLVRYRIGAAGGEGNSRWRPALPVMFAGPPPADRGSIPPPGQLWRPALPVPPAGPPPSELRRAIQTRAPGPFGPGGSQCRSGKFGRGTGRPPKEGAATEPWKERFFSRAVCSPPLGRRDHEAPRPQDGTGSTRSAGGFVRPATSAGSRTRRTRAGACGRGRGQPGGWRRSTRPRGGTGRPPGGCKRALRAG